ncbi:MAG: alpha/beta fold hydrolase [Candidatus Hermodarchaeota archaeon]
MPFFNYNNKKIFYQIKKNTNKNALLFIHGSGSTSNIWKNQMNLEINYDVIAIDLPSHHKSDVFFELSLDLYVDVINKFINSFNYKNLIICGHSLGGAIAQAYYFKHPNEVKALILCGTGGRLRVSTDILNSLKNNYQEFLNSLNMGFYKTTLDSIVQDYREETSKVGAQVTYQDFKICDNFDTLDKTHTIGIPCLILCGVKDNLTPVKYSKYFHEKVEKSKLVIIEKAGHMIMLEKPEEVNQAIKDFLRFEFN